MQEKVEEHPTLLQKINNRTNGHFEAFCIKHSLCPECIGDLEERDGDVVCTACGLVVSNFAVEEEIPFGELKTPEGELSDGHGLGMTLGGKGLFCVLANANGVTDLPIRAKQISVMVRKVEHPKIMTMIRYGQLLVKNWGYAEREKWQHIIVRHSLGQLIHKVGAYIVLSEWRVNLKQVTEICFVLTLKRLFGERMFQEATQKLNVDLNLLIAVDILGAIAKDNDYGKIGSILRGTKEKQVIFPLKNCACETCPQRQKCY
jgi:hypothetical protein